MTGTKRFLLTAIASFSILLVSGCTEEEALQGTMVAIGDSITFGANLDDREETAYPFLMGEEAGVKVHNLAVSGWQIGEVMNALKQDTEYQQTVQEADYIAMTIGGNDLLEVLSMAEAESGGDPERMTQIIQEEIGPNTVFERIAELIEEIQSISDAEILLYNIYNPFPSNSNIHELGEAILPEVNRAFADITESYEGVYLADAYSAYDGKQQAYIIADDIHPTEEGQAVLAEIGLEALELE